MFPSPLCKGKVYTPNVAIRSPRSGLCSPLWVTCHHSLCTPATQATWSLLLTCRFLLCTFAHPGPSAWNDLACCPAHSSITSSGKFSLSPCTHSGPEASGLGSWPSLGIPVTLCPPCVELLCVRVFPRPASSALPSRGVNCRELKGATPFCFV